MCQVIHIARFLYVAKMYRYVFVLFYVLRARTRAGTKD